MLEPGSTYMKLKGTMYVELTLYLGLGLSVLLVWDSVLQHMHEGELMLIAGESLPLPLPLPLPLLLLI